MIPLNLLLVPATVAVLLGVVQVFYMFRARAMRTLAARWGFQYIGPPAPKWRNRSYPENSPPLPSRFRLIWNPSGREITHVWNLIEGQQNGVSLVVFDCILGKGKGSSYCTLIASQTEQNPFGTVTSPDRLIQSHGWTILHGVWFLWFSWTMRMQRVERHVKKLQVGTAEQQH